jgi:outer membrane lipoprotein-sorting protein
MMLLRLFSLALMLVLALPFNLHSQTPQSPASEGAIPTSEELFQIFEGFRTAYEKVEDYTAKLHKEERNERGKWHKEVIDFKFKKPFAVRMKWLQGSDREAAFVEGKYDNKITVKLGGLISIIIPKVHLDPESDMAKDDSGHTIREAGLGYMMEEIVKVTEDAHGKGDLGLKLLTVEKKNGSNSNILKVERTLPGGKGYATEKLIIYVDEELGLPVGVERYDAKGKVFGKYYYRDLKVNQNLEDSVFKL